MASLDAARRRRRRRPLLLIGLACTTRALAPTETRRWTALRRTAGCAALAVAAPIAPAFAALNPNLGQLDPNGPNQGVVIGLDEDAPFRAALGQIKALLDTLGVEGTVAKIKPAEPDGPIHSPGLRGGPAAGDGSTAGLSFATPKCLSGTRGPSRKKVHPALRVLRPEGRRCRELTRITLFSAADATVLTAAKGNFFNGAGVYVLAELYDGAAVFDVEFQFLPGVLENIVEARILARENAQATSEAREKELLEVFGRALGWLPLDQQTIKIPGLTDDEKGVISTTLGPRG